MIAYLVLLASLGFVIFVEGLLNPFWLWNALPIVLTAAWLFRARRRETSTTPAAAFGVGAVGVTLHAHLAWWFDWGSLATGSSTAAFLFIVLPCMAVAAGLICWGVARLALFVRQRA